MSKLKSVVEIFEIFIGDSIVDKASQLEVPSDGERWTTFMVEVSINVYSRDE